MSKKLPALITNALVPAGLTILGNIPSLLKSALTFIQINVTDTQLPLLANISFAAGVAWASIALPYRIYRIEEDKERLLELTEHSMAEAKKIFLTALRRDLNNQQLDLQIRVFMPRKNICDWLTRKKWFEIKNHTGLTEKNKFLDGLKFRCKPNPQGVVGMTYTEQEIVWAADVSGSAERYNITREQQNITVDTRFVMCVPIVKDEKVKSIISFDSHDVVDISNADRTKWQTLVRKFAQLVHSNSPYLKS